MSIVNQSLLLELHRISLVIVAHEEDPAVVVAAHEEALRSPLARWQVPFQHLQRLVGALGGEPLVVQQFVGAGRVLFLGFEESWRWRFRADEPRFNQFWIQMVRYLARVRPSRAEIRLDRQTPYRRP